MQAPKVKFHARKDRMEQLISFTYNMIRAVKMAPDDELSKEQYLELHELEDTLSKLYKQVTDAR